MNLRMDWSHLIFWLEYSPTEDLLALAITRSEKDRMVIHNHLAGRGVYWSLAKKWSLKSVFKLRLKSCPPILDCVFLLNVEELSISPIFPMISIDWLVGLPKLRYIKLSLLQKISNLSAFKRLPCLKELHLSDNNTIMNLFDISNCIGLTKLSLENFNGLKDTSSICQLINLEEFKFRGRVDSGFDSLNRLRKLKILHLDLIEYKYDLRVLQKLPSLIELSLHHLAVVNLDFLTGIEIRSLHIDTLVWLTDISSIATMKKLKNLVISTCLNLRDFSYIGDVVKTHLEYLIIRDPIFNDNVELHDCYAFTDPGL